MHSILMAIDPRVERLLEGAFDGFTAIPEMAWDHLLQVDEAAFYNLGFLTGLVVLVALVAGLPLRWVGVALAIAILMSFITS